MGWYTNQMARYNAAKSANNPAKSAAATNPKLGSYFPTFAVYGDRIEGTPGMSLKRQTFPINGVEARVESANDATARLSVTRLVVLGPLSLAAPKRSGGHSYLVITGPDFAWTEEVPKNRQLAARKFAEAVNLASRQAIQSGR